jgi:phage shock protein PspC (stress-responsive transcriptional regulator)
MDGEMEKEPILVEKNKDKDERLLFRSRRDYLFAGVIGGLANYWNINSTFLRLIFLISIPLTGFITFILYFLLIKLIPLESEV